MYESPLLFLHPAVRTMDDLDSLLDDALEGSSWGDPSKVSVTAAASSAQDEDIYGDGADIDL